MAFNLNHMKESCSLFWDAYFQALELLDEDRGKCIEEVPIAREIPITDEIIFRIGRNRAKWELVYLPLDCSWPITEPDDVERGLHLLSIFLEYQVD